MTELVTLLGALAFVASWLLVSMLRRAAPAVDIPNERSSHAQPTPRGGGLAIALFTLVGLIISGVAMGTQVSPSMWGLCLSGAVVAAVGYLDDRFTVRARYRFAAQFAAAFIAIASYGYWANGRLPIIGSIGILWLGVAVVWIVGLINAYNFMDGIDGIAGGVAVVAALWWIALFPKEPMWSIGVLLVAAALGFLLHNWSPARIFMGDVGSTFLGCMFAVLPLMLEVPVIGGLLMWPFLFDTGFTFLRRLLRREDIFSAHRDHLYQRLIISGWSHASVALLYIALTAVSGFFAWLWMQGVEPTAYFWLVGSAVGLLWLVHTQSAARQPAG